MCGIQNEIQKATNELDSITNDKQNHTGLGLGQKKANQSNFVKNQNTT